MKKNEKIDEKNKPVFVHAKLATRIKAFVIDTFMIYMPIMYVTTYIFLSGRDDLQNSQFAPVVAMLIYGIIYAFFISKFTQTPGRKAYDIRVVSAKNAKNISFLRAFVRFIIFLFTATTVLGLLLPFIRNDKKAFYDLVCKTIVVGIKDKTLL